jgi:hypothetical protein
MCVVVIPCCPIAGDQLSRNIVIGGEWVDLSEPGTYFTKYACADEKGLKAEDVFRKIVVHGESEPKHPEMRL